VRKKAFPVGCTVQTEPSPSIDHFLPTAACTANTKIVELGIIANQKFHQWL
jgi:hypothetical protein